MSNDILAYIPQRPPFVMVGRVLSAGADVVETSFMITDDNLFTVNGMFTEPGIVEHMAQSAAAGTGYLAQQEGKPAPVGYIGALKNLVINVLPQTGDIINTRITFAYKVMNAHIVMATVTNGTETVATCELKIFLNA